PRPSDGKKMVSFDWVPIRYRNVISILKNPFYAGAYVYGKSEKRTEIVDGRVRKSYGLHVVQRLSHRRGGGPRSAGGGCADGDRSGVGG
ncbi:hypothetical protein EOA86_18970, partial [Mesorhizobium sp. M5C.F.Ca.IN.020.32.2.1]